MNAKRKKVLVVCRRAPYGDSLSRAALDVVLAGAAFNQDLSVLFLDDGVWQLMPQQQASSIEQKSVAATLESLPLYDVEQFYVAAASLQQRQLSPSELAGNVALLDDSSLTSFIESHDQVLGF